MRVVAGRLARLVEGGAWTVGLLALLVWVAGNVSGTVGARQDIARFREHATPDLGASAPDTTSWSEKRIREWRESLTRTAPPPLALMRIPRIGLEVAVLAGTDDWTLNRAVGHIEGTAAPGTAGNVGIAGHRDGFFRGLEHIAVGDVIEVETRNRLERFRIERTWIVRPEDVWVIDPTDAPSITLVTCYPFYFIGSAPQRFIVRAVRAEMVAKQPPPS
jgi:sortase A